MAREDQLKTRCEWAATEPMILYHDEEWGVPVHEDRKLFEFLVLEGAQAGLSWQTVLKRREGYRAAFDGFDPERIVTYGASKIEELMADPGIIRNRLKVESTISNARAFLDVRDAFGSFDAYVWRFVDNKPIENLRLSVQDLPATTPESDAMSKDMKRRGFRFVGSTICYAFMQATGMVDDHVRHCFRFEERKTRS